MKRATTVLLVLVGILLAGSHCVRASQPVPAEHLIVPGVGVGDCTLGMSKDEVLKKLGEPQSIELGKDQVVRRGEEKYSLQNLPRNCILYFSNISFRLKDGSVQTIFVWSSRYKLSNGLGVGDSEQNIKQAFGKDYKAEQATGMHYLGYDAQGLAFEIDEKNDVVAQIVVYAKREDPRVLKTLPKYDPNSDNPFQVDLRGRDLSKLDWRASLDDLLYAVFDDRTIWPIPDRMPAGFDWHKIMELGKNPGLGVRRLHKEGITGRGVRIAIIDQPLLVDHQEYADRVRLYEEMDLQGRKTPAMHGAGVASIALGKTVGVAPEAELYYIARPGIPIPLQQQARYIHRIIEVNAQLPKDNKIRVISISKGWRPSDEGYKEIMEAVHKAQAAGMLFVCTSVEQAHEEFDFDALGRSPLADPDVFESYEPGLFRARDFWSGGSSPSGISFSVPMDARTTASPAGIDEYVFYKIGGYSWAVPYIAGVYALAVQADPAITPERFWALAVRTGRTIELKRGGVTKPLGPIIDPVRLIRAIQAGETATLDRQHSDNRNVQMPLPTNSETQTIVAGVRVGDYALGMTKDEVLKKLGEPQTIQLGENEVVRRGEEKYSHSNLPSKCILGFGDVSFWIGDDVVRVMSVRGPLYKLSNGLGVGDSEQNIKQAFGADCTPREEMGKNYLCYDAQGLAFAIHEKNRAATEIVVYHPEGSAAEGPREVKTLPKYDPDSGKPFQVDLRGRDLSKLDLRASLEDLRYADFDDRTVWPAPERMPSGFDWHKIVELGKNPGLGVRRLHEKGITGRGVRIAIIDQPLLVDHQEYAGRVRLYEEIDLPGRTEPAMHGAAVASLALGKTVGVAPEAELYYIAMQFFGGIPLQRLARSIHRIIEVNAQLPKDNKIRVISISKGWMPSHEGYKDIMEAVQKAQAAGMLIVCTGGAYREGFDFGVLGRSPWADPDVFESYEPGLFTAKRFWSRPPSRADRSSSLGDSFSVPMDSRTTASPAGIDEYVFYRIGGASWAVPYVAGVYALAVQADPAITPERFWALAVRTGRTIELERNDGRRPLGPIIDPVGLIRAIQAGETAALNQQPGDNQNVQAPPQTNSDIQTIVPGVGVGDYKLGMSKDEVETLRKSGEPEGMQFVMRDGVVKEISVSSPLYKFTHGLGVGDSEEKIQQALGPGFRLEEFEGKDLLTYENQHLQFEIDKKKRTVREITLFKTENNQQTDRRSGQDVSAMVRQAAAEGRIAFNLTTPEEFKALAGLPTREGTQDNGKLVVMEYPDLLVRFFGNPGIKTPHTVIEVSCAGRQIDIGRDRPIVLRHEGDLGKFGPFWGYSGVDLSRLDLSAKGELLKVMAFDSLTVWPQPDLLPPDFDPKKVMDWGRDPGLRVKQLHERGITGQGVHVAIIDQPLLLDHVEYKDQLAGYTDVDTERPGPTMHGAGVASLLVGKTCGTAPGAILHFWAEPSWKGDYQYRCRALEQIMQYNRHKRKSEQIRIVSVSKGLSREPNLDRWKALLAKAAQAGIYVVHCGKMGFGAGCRFLKDAGDPANYRLAAFHGGGRVDLGSGTLFTPIDYRTTASPRARDVYVFWTAGGLNWGAPYIAGVVALGLQVNPDLPADQIDKLLYDSGWDFQRGKLINPLGFVDAARSL